MIDVTVNRRSRKWSHREQIGRILWAIITPFFRFSPRPFWGWRRMLLRLFGSNVGHQVHVYPSVRISIPWNIELGDQSAVGDRAILYALGRISIGERATISQGAHLCAGTHDLSTPDRALVKPPITINEDVWVAADAFIGPGVNIGKGAVVGARSVVFNDVNARWIVVGNPARPLREL